METATATAMETGSLSSPWQVGPTISTPSRPGGGIPTCEDKTFEKAFEPALEWSFDVPDMGTTTTPVVANLTDDNDDGSVDQCDTPDVVLLATGSEVGLAVEAARELEGSGIRARIVSMPCVELFLARSDSDQDAVLPDDGTPIVAIEAGRGETLRRFVGRRGLVIGMESFGASAPYSALAEHFGFTAASVAKRIKAHV